MCGTFTNVSLALRLPTQARLCHSSPWEMDVSAHFLLGQDPETGSERWLNQTTEVCNPAASIVGPSAHSNWKGNGKVSSEEKLTDKEEAWHGYCVNVPVKSWFSSPINQKREGWNGIRYTSTHWRTIALRGCSLLHVIHYLHVRIESTKEFY